jgi:rubrerythrin
MKPVASATLTRRQQQRAHDARVERRELVCACCGYGIVVRGRVPTCPMCRSESWEPLARIAPAR